MAERRAERAAERIQRTGVIPDTLKAIIDEYFQREGEKLRTAHDRRRDLDRLVMAKLSATSPAKTSSICSMALRTGMARRCPATSCAISAGSSIGMPSAVRLSAVRLCAV